MKLLQTSMVQDLFEIINQNIEREKSYKGRKITESLECSIVYTGSMTQSQTNGSVKIFSFLKEILM